MTLIVLVPEYIVLVINRVTVLVTWPFPGAFINVTVFDTVGPVTTWFAVATVLVEVLTLSVLYTSTICELRLSTVNVSVMST